MSDPNNGKSVSSPAPSLDDSKLESGVVKEEVILPSIVGWDGDNDPLNPMNWTSKKKWTNLGTISVMALITPIASAMFAPAVPKTMLEFHSSNSYLETFVVSIFILGFAFGPLVAAPLSEVYGRRPVYVFGGFLFCVLIICCAVSNSLGMLIAFRFLAGCAGSVPVTLGGATVGDMFPTDRRGVAMGIWGIGPLLGPTIGPVIGGYLSEDKGWRWVFWLQAILSGTTFAFGLVFLRETYSVVILERKAKDLRKSTGNEALVSFLHDGLSVKDHLSRAIVRPINMLIRLPMIMLLSVYMGFLFGSMYLFITNFPLVFERQYGFSSGATGLTYLGLGIGCLLGLPIGGKISDVLYKKLEKKNKGEGKPEFRLPPLAVSAPLVAVSFFWYGWSAQAKVHWIVPIIGTIFFGMGMMPGILSINMYIVQAYGIHAASALAATKVLQMIGGAFLPLAGPPLFDRLKLGWGNSLLAFIALAFVPVPWVFYVYGERLRVKYAIKS